MASKELIEKIGQRFNEDTLLRETEFCLKDLDDRYIVRMLVDRQPGDYWQLIRILAEDAKDPEVRAHILGWESAADQQADLEACRKLQESMKL